MLSLITKNCALLAIYLCTNLYPAQQNDENFLTPDSSPRYTKMRPPPIKAAKRCDCSEHETNIKKYNPNTYNHAGRKFFRHWSISENILANDKT